MGSIRVIAGLGNPGSRYAGTRHNIGFVVVDTLHEICRSSGGTGRGASAWKLKGDAEIAEVSIEGEVVRVMKPLAYMNRSGEVVGALLRFHKVEPAELLVVHDDIDLPVGVIRVKAGGGEAGHNGLRSITEVLGSRDYCRLRLGVGKPERREDEDAVARYVLGRFGSDDREVMSGAVNAAAEAVLDLCAHGLRFAQNRYNG